MFRPVLAAVAGLCLAAAGAQKAGAANLEELKYAVEVAGKRGGNVAAIADAVAAFEKAQARTAFKEGEAPAELTALREAVEAAAKKGEDVEAISKEVGLIEKALTGKEYERPKPPEPKLEPVPPLRRGGFGRGGFGRGGFNPGGFNPGGFNPGGFGGGFGGQGVVIGNIVGDFDATSMTLAGGDLFIKARKGEVTYTVRGTVGAADAPMVTILDGSKKIETDDIKKVPEEYRPSVEKLLKSFNR